MRKLKGFTLIELMVVIAIVAVLAAIALPNFTGQAQKTRRGDAYAGLQQASALMEKGFVTSRAYNETSLGADGTALSPERYYEITVAVDGRAYTLRAEPVDGGPQAGDADCTALILASTGAKDSEGERDNPLDCWR